MIGPYLHFLPLCCTLALAVEPESLPLPDQPAPVEPSLTKLDDGRMKLGEITFDPKSREIRFPAAVNQTDGLLEFLIVHINGKVHESLLNTEISATNLNVIFKLLRYPASREFYLKINPNGTLSGEYETATDEEKAGSRVKFNVEWQVDGETKTSSLNDWVTHAVTEKPMPAEPWVYGGSFSADGKFIAEISGDIAAIYLSNAALINYSGKDNENDDVWLPHPNRVPEEGTPVTVVIQPLNDPQP